MSYYLSSSERGLPQYNYHKPSKRTMVSDFIWDVLAYTGASQVDVVSHSMGVTMGLFAVEEHSHWSRVRRFIEDLRPAIDEDVPIIESDERLTTVAAMEKLHEAGRTEKNSRDRIDQAAAVEILQEFLDFEKIGLEPDAGPDR